MTKTKADIETSQDELKKYESLINVTYNEELYKSVVKDFLSKKDIIKDPILLAKIIFKKIYLSKKGKKYIFEFTYNL